MPANSSITVRPAEQRDLPMLGKMGASMVRFHYNYDSKRFILPDDPASGYAWWLGKESENPKAVVLVAEQANEDGTTAVIGYTYGRVEETNWGVLLGPHADFLDIWVEEHVRHSGAGRKLVEATLAKFKSMGAPQVVLMTAVQNEPAQKLAEAFGFRSTMIEMTKELK